MFRGMTLMLGTSLGGWIGWALAARFGFMAAFLVSVIGSAVGLYWTRRLLREYLD